MSSILQLRVHALVCPCGLDYGFCSGCNDEYDFTLDTDARRSALILQSIKIRWYRKVYWDDTITQSLAKDFIGTQLPINGTEFIDFEATFNLIDTPDGPAIQIISDDSRQQYHKFVVDDFEEKLQQKNNSNLAQKLQYAFGLNPITRKVYLLKDLKVDMSVVSTDKLMKDTLGISTDDCSVGLPSFNNGNVKIYGSDDTLFGVSKTILQFDVAPPNKYSIFPGVKGSDVLQHLNVLIAWDRRRRERILYQQICSNAKKN